MITVSAIANASQGQLLCITYEIFLYHIQEALEESKENRAEHISKSVEVIKMLTEDLNFDLPLSQNLFRLYVYMQGILLEQHVTNEKLLHVYQIMDRLYKGFLEITGQEEQRIPSMKNAEAVYAGLTYGKNDLNELIITDQNRGFKA